MKHLSKRTHQWIVKTLILLVFFILSISNANSQMPPPGYERAKKQMEEQMKISPLDRDSITMTETVEVLDPTTLENTRMVVTSRMSLRDYCFRYLGMGNADILLDGNPHTIVDPDTYEELTIKFNPEGRIDTIPK